jgi:hypothetical protein
MGLRSGLDTIVEAARGIVLGASLLAAPATAESYTLNSSNFSLSGTPSWQQQKKPVPDSSKQKEAEDKLKKDFPAEFQTGDTSKKKAFAQALLKSAAETPEEAMRFVLYKLAAKLAAEANDAETAYDSIDIQTREFDTKHLDLKSDLINKAKGKTAPEALSRLSQKLAEDAVFDNDYATAIKAAKDSEAMAKTAKDSLLEQKAAAYSKDLAEMKKLYETAQKAKTVIEDKKSIQKAVEQASTDYGKWLAFVRSDWTTGPMYLKDGSDQTLKALAEAEIAKPRDAREQLALADKFYSAAEKITNAYEKKRILARAGTWYREALPALDGLNASKARTRLKEIEPVQSLDLLKIVDLNRDKIRGEWKYDGKTLSSQNTGNATLQLPFAIDQGQEYELSVTVTRKTGTDSLYVVLPLPSGKQAMIVVDGWPTDGYISGIQTIDNKGANANETSKKGQVLAANATKQLNFIVREDLVALTVDGREHLRYAGDMKKFTIPTTYSSQNPKAIQLGAFGTAYDITKANITTAAGKGQLLK